MLSIMLRFLLVLGVSFSVFANTEIVNFHVSETYNDALPFTNNWPRLNHSHNEREWSMFPAPSGTPMQEVCNSDVVNSACPYELWLVLDLTRDWSAYSSFTLRLSWPASYPADFSLKVFDPESPESLSAHFEPPNLDPSLTPHTPSSLTHIRFRYARIRLVDIGVLTPSPTSHKDSPTSSTSIPFILILEPLYFGVLPASVTPVLGYIFVVSIIAYAIVPPLINYLEGMASQARKELSWYMYLKHD